MWKDDSELFEITKNELYTAVVGDIMDQFGFLHQFLPPEIKPLQQDMVIIGLSTQKLITFEFLPVKQDKNIKTNVTRRLSFIRAAVRYACIATFARPRRLLLRRAR